MTALRDPGRPRAPWEGSHRRGSQVSGCGNAIKTQSFPRSQSARVMAEQVWTPLPGRQQKRKLPGRAPRPLPCPRAARGPRGEPTCSRRGVGGARRVSAGRVPAYPVGAGPPRAPPLHHLRARGRRCHRRRRRRRLHRLGQSGPEPRRPRGRERRRRAAAEEEEEEEEAGGRAEGSEGGGGGKFGSGLAGAAGAQSPMEGPGGPHARQTAD